MAYIGKQPTPVPLSASDLDDDIISLAKMAGGTDGNLITYDASGNPVAVATGNDGQVLTSAGAGAPCLFEAAPGGGKVLQVVSAVDGTARATTSTSWVTASSTLTLDITPSATSSKILLMLSTGVFINANDGAITIYRDSTNLGHADYGFSYLHIIAGYTHPTIIELDAPSSTSQITYKMYLRNPSGGSTLTAGSESLEGSLVAMEIGA